MARREEVGGGWELAYRGTDLMEVQLPGAAAGGEDGLVTRCASGRRPAAVRERFVGSFSAGAELSRSTTRT
jgi:hypothetical protein